MATKIPPAKIVKRAAKTLAGTVAPAQDEARKKTVALFEKAVKSLHAGHFDKAHVQFTEMLAGAPLELADRIRMYITTCVAQINKGTTDFRSHEEQYDYAISLLNHGHYSDARKHFNEILLANSTADYAFYGLAVLSSMTGTHDECLEHLAEAIRLNPQNRLLARSDSDFADVADNPGFTELLYPEA